MSKPERREIPVTVVKASDEDKEIMKSQAQPTKNQVARQKAQRRATEGWENEGGAVLPSKATKPAEQAQARKTKRRES